MSPHGYGFSLRLCALVLLLSFGAALAACAPEDYAQELELTGLGVVYMGDFRYDSARDEAELFNGVCFASTSEPTLTLRAPAMRVERVQTEPTFVVEGATLALPGYTIFAERLSGSAQGLGLQNLSVMSPPFSGSAVRARYTLASGRTILTGVKLRLGNFRVESAAAGLNSSTLVLQDARATTCACEGGGLYALRAPEVSIDLRTGIARVEGGTLHTLGLRLALDPNLRLLLDGAPRPGGRINVGGTALLPSVAAPEPVGDVIEQGTKIAVPVQLFPGASLELGVAGFSAEHPVGPVALLNLGVKLDGSNLRAALGRVGPGWRADALVRTPLAPGIGFDVSTTHRDWEDAGFLHEGALGLFASRRFRGVAGEVADALVLGGQVFTAFSQQTLSGTLVRSLRLGARGNAFYAGAPTPVGRFALRSGGEVTLYPGSAEHPAQFGVRLAPSWRASFGPLRSALSLDHQAVFGRSPFSASLDRLRPRSVADGFLTLGGAGVGRGLGSILSVQGRYAFRLEGAVNPVRRMRLEAVYALPLGATTLENRLTAEVAGLLGPPDPEVDAFLGAETAFELPASELELGFRARYNLLPEARGLELLEVYTSYPLTFSSVMLRPFLALNAAPLFTDTPLPGVSGYGLAVAFRSCCGTLVASYRLHDRSVRTSFDVRLAPDEVIPK